MKITVIGGGGVRAPLFVASALRRAKTIHLDEICLMDIRPEKLEIMAAISREVGVERGGALGGGERGPGASLSGPHRSEPWEHEPHTELGNMNPASNTVRLSVGTAFLFRCSRLLIRNMGTPMRTGTGRPSRRGRSG